ncbi:MAG: Gfo/Idh/MocA family oxidoreductase [Devosiaceae bacterium]|nr:Gfo/Idh/MocA family oxidoreductase [Devosiaceae bacterium]
MRLIIVGTGGMAAAHAQKFGEIDGVDIVGATDLDSGRLKEFCDRFNIEHRFASLDKAIIWGKFQAAANVTPDHVHYGTTMALLKAGKHVFCEKPLATDFEKAQEMTDTARQKGLVGMVNLSYRDVPHIHVVRAMIEGGKIGVVKHVEASYLQSWLVSNAWGQWDTESQWLWRLSKEHGSNGVLGDVGIHILDFISFGIGQDIASFDCRLKTFSKAEGDRIGEYKLDANDSFAMTLEFGNGAIGVVHASRWATGHLNELRLRVHGDKGALEVVHQPDKTVLRGCLGEDVHQAKWHDIDVELGHSNYRSFVKAVGRGKQMEPSFEQGARLQRVLDLCLVADNEGRRQTV